MDAVPKAIQRSINRDWEENQEVDGVELCTGTRDTDHGGDQTEPNLENFPTETDA